MEQPRFDPHPVFNTSDTFAARQAVVDRAREGWIKKLIDLSRRNNLLYYRDLQSGTLDLSHGEGEALAALFVGERVPIDRFVPLEQSVQARARVASIHKRAILNLEEKGIETLFVALGMATWTPSDDGRPPAAAVLLLPVAIETRGRERQDVFLRRSGGAQVNIVLLHVLETAFGRGVSAEQLLDGWGGEDEPFDLDTVYGRLSEVCAGIPGFAVRSAAVLSNFSFQKLAMVRDLRERGLELAAHDIIAAIAGDAEARQQVRTKRVAVDASTLDQMSPDDEFLVFDADASQQCVVMGVLMGEDGVVQGPPGTGKSQTIANVIASLAAQGKRVLFVAEKRAALEVVRRRLEAVGLGHLLLDLHGADISRRLVMQQFADSLVGLGGVPRVAADEVHARFAERRRRLNAHVQQLHVPRVPSGLSMYALHNRLLQMPQGPRAMTRWRGAALQLLDAATATTVRDLLQEAAGFGGLFLRDDPSPWTGAPLLSGSDVADAMDLVSQLLHNRWPALQAALASVIGSTGLREPQTLAETAALIELLTGIEQTLANYDAALFEQDLPALVAAMEPATAGWFRTGWARLTDADYRSARATARGLRVEPVPDADMHAELRAADEQLRHWQQSDPRTYPCIAEGRIAATEALATFTSELDELSHLLARPTTMERSYEELLAMLESLALDTTTPHRLPCLLDIERRIDALHAGAIVAELRHAKPEPRHWSSLFEHAWLQSCLDAGRAQSPELAGFNGDTHDAVVEEFANGDRYRLTLAAARVSRAHAEHAVRTMNAHVEQTLLVRREAEKRTRLIPLRRLMKEAADVLTALRPCWMASPLSVSQLLDGERRYFDVVIFDEASQVPPEDAIASLLRGSQAVVAGDKYQLPPTTFFAAGEGDGEEAEEAGATEGFESVLDLMSGFFEPWTLLWHYRSRDESLIAFANKHIYNNRLVTFPGTSIVPAVKHVLVRPTQHRPDDDSVAEEVRQVVDLVLDHAANRPNQTLGVITMGIKHAQRIEDALDTILPALPQFDNFFDQRHDERFFVKNLERVQGDERDAIILSVGYGKDREGRLPYRFGPLLMRGGERRLNVAITRARQHMTVVSSFDHLDMDPARSSARGVELLRQYLHYANDATHVSPSSDADLDAFELDVLTQLRASGMPVVARYGASNARIDFAIGHASEEGRLLVALETDGSAYAGMFTARDRDRLRRQQLESLGWHYHRLWALDWFNHREREVAAIVDAYMTAVARAEHQPSGSNHAPAVVAPTPQLNEGAATGVTVRLDNEAVTGVTVRLDQRAPLVERGARPDLGRRASITQYSEDELVALVRWIASDERLRTDEEIVNEMIDELGFSRRGPRIVTTLRRAIARANIHGRTT